MSLTKAIDAVISFLDDHTFEMTRSKETKFFGALAETVHDEAHSLDLLGVLPKKEDQRPANHIAGTELQFLSVLNLPGDWLPDKFLIGGTEQWLKGMKRLKRSAEKKPKKKKHKNRKKNINASMLKMMKKDHACWGWNSRQWAECLKCSRPAVTGTDAWKLCEKERFKIKAEKISEAKRNKPTRRAKGSDIRKRQGQS